MVRVLTAFLVILLAATAYLLLAPIDIEPVAWEPQPAPPSDSGPYAKNDLLKSIERIALNIGKGPESVAFDAQGRVYAGLDDGRVARFEPDGSGYKMLANTSGRPLGLFIHPDGRVIVCDADQGLLSISPAGQLGICSSTAEHEPFHFTDDL